MIIDRVGWGRIPEQCDGDKDGAATVALHILLDGGDIMSKKDECEIIDCPKCGSTAYYGDNGIHCTNANCPNSRG